MADSVTGERTEDEPAMKVAHPWWALVGTLIGVSMIVIDGSIVNVLLPDMVDDIGLTQIDTQWVNSIYALVFASLLITVGLLADKHGRRLLFVIGAVVFIAGSIASGSAHDAGFLIGARAVQALGASMMLPSSIAVINVMFTGRQRAMAFGMWGAVFGGAAALGPLLGGWLAEDFSWRWAFLINIPIAIISLILVFKFVPETKGMNRGRIDIVGVVLSAVGLGVLVWGLIEGQQYGWWTAISSFDIWFIHFNVGGLSVVPVLLLVGVLLLVLLVLWEMHLAHIGKPGLVDLELFGIRRYSFGNIVALIVSLGEFGILFALPLWIQSVHEFDPLTTGAILATLAIGTLTAGGAARHLAARWGATDVVRIGMVLEIIGILAVAFTLSVDINPWWLSIPLIVYGVGLGLDAAQLTNVVLADVPPIKSGQASAMTSTFRQVGSAFGSAILGAVLFTGLSQILTDELSNEAGVTAQQRDEIVNEVQTTAGQAIVILDNESQQKPELKPIVDDAQDAYTEAARLTAFAAAFFVLLGLIFSFGLPRDRPGEETDPVTDENDTDAAEANDSVGKSG